MTTADPTDVERLAGALLDDDGILRVTKDQSCRPLASVIAHHLYAGQPVTLRAIGAGAVGQAVKAMAIARGFVAPRGIDIAVVPAFDNVVGSRGDTLSAITLRVVRLT